MNWNSIARLSACALTSFSFFAAPASAQGLQAIEIGTGFASPTSVQPAPGDADRLFVTEQSTGRIRILKNGVINATPFLDIGAISSGGGERGLLSMAFHPDYFIVGASGEGKFYVNYTNNGGNTVVRQYNVSANPDIADPSTFVNIVTITQPFSNHNGGCIAFGADGFLYVATGDGGSGNDPGNRAQNPLNNLGKMLRFDVDIAAPFIPASNPFVGNASTNDEIWALGLRNPYRFTFDRMTGDMWIGDVGQNAREEVDFESASSTGGLNYGWRCMEGLNCTGLSGCTCNSAALTLPVDTYPTSSGNCSVIGGYRYRGSAMPNFAGKYFYTDYCSGRFWSVDFDGVSISNKVEHEADLGIPGGKNISAFGEDVNGELLLCDQNGGQIYRVAEDCVSTQMDYCPGSVNSTGSAADLQVSGSTILSNNNMVLTVLNAPANVPGLFFYGQGSANTPLADGTLCVSGPIFRLQPANFTDSFGIAVRNVDFTVLTGPGIITPGTPWNFQYWYRDVAAMGAGSNLSDAVEIVFCP